MGFYFELAVFSFVYFKEKKAITHVAKLGKVLFNVFVPHQNPDYFTLKYKSIFKIKAIHP